MPSLKYEDIYERALEPDITADFIHDPAYGFIHAG